MTATMVARRGRDGLTVAFGMWLMAGLFLDGFVHNTRGDQLESFFTPWHAALYSGFVASALWIAWPALTSQGTWRDRLASLPAGYSLGLVGVVVFAVGGMADTVWHSLLGIEVDLEALVSPPHLVLFCGAMLILTTPARAAWARPASEPGFREFFPTLMSFALAALLAGFFFMYASGLYDFHAMTVFQGFVGAEIARTPFLAEVFNAYGILARLFTTVILMLPVLLLLRRWTPPRGSFTVLFTTYGSFMLVLNEFRHPELGIAVVIAGLAADLLSGRLRRGESRRHGVYLLAVAVPATLWLVHFGVLAVTGNLAWPFALWGGVVMFGVGIGLALAVMAFPPPAAEPGLTP